MDENKPILHFKLPTRDSNIKSFKPKINRDVSKDRYIELEDNIIVTINTDSDVKATYQGIRNLYVKEPDAIIEFKPALYKHDEELGTNIRVGDTVRRKIEYGALNLSYEFRKKTKGIVTDIKLNKATHDNKVVTGVFAIIDNDYVASAHTLIRTT